MASTEGCCPPTRVPKLEKSTTGKGKFVLLEKNEGVKVYVSGDATSKKVVVCHPDIFGYNTGRHTAICDYYADNGFFVVMPDYFANDPLKGGFPEYIAKHLIKDIRPILDETYERFISNEVESVFMIGFCYGCWSIFNDSKRDVLPGKFKYAFCFHPSVQIEGLSGGNTEELCRSIKHPMTLVPTNNDVEFVQKGTFLENQPFNCVVRDYTHQEHGFMTQGDYSTNERMEKDIATLLQESVRIFSKY